MGDYSCCVYRSKDPVRNFKIKVTLQRSTGKLFAGYDPLESDSFDRELQKYNWQPTTAAGGAALDAGERREEQVIEWQTKIFSKREYLKYTMVDFKPASILEDKYRAECLKLKERNYAPGRIFTYIDSDPYEYHDEIDAEVNNAPASAIPIYLEKMAEKGLKKRRPLVGNTRPDDARNVPRSNIVKYTANDDDKKMQARVVPFHTMYIMADLSTEKNTFTMNDERVLCCIKINMNGAISVKPNFSNQPYTVQAGGFAKATYEYLLEHVSAKISVDELQRELRLHNELYRRHADFVKNLVGHDFQPPRTGLKVHVYGEIVSARNFDYDDLHVYYQLELPGKNWHIVEPASVPISGFTHTARTKTEGVDEVAYFAHPFEFDLYYKNDENNPKNRDELPPMPRILFEVASYDSWSRYRVEGYAWTQLSVEPGMYRENLPCWRPRGDSLVYELRRFFIGGSPELDDITYACRPGDHEGAVLSRLGFRTVTTGTLGVQINTVFQSQVFIDKKTHKNGTKQDLLDKMGHNTNMSEIISVLEAFNLAKMKMIEARENSRKLLDD